MIELTDVHKTYHLGKTEVTALRGVTLHIAKGEFVSVMGPSGSGKTTLLNLIGCLDKPDRGTVTIDGINIKTLNRNELADLRISKIGFIFQTFNLIPVLNVYENIEFPLYIKREKLTDKERKNRILSLIEEIGLSSFIKHKPDELSGGQRQRVAIARALVTKPEIVLADEPTANLDSQTGHAIIELMNELNTKEQVTFLFATHDPSITKYATQVYKLKDGTLEK